MEGKKHYIWNYRVSFGDALTEVISQKIGDGDIHGAIIIISTTCTIMLELFVLVFKILIIGVTSLGPFTRTQKKQNWPKNARPITDPNIYKYLVESKILLPERTGTEKNRPK